MKILLAEDSRTNQILIRAYIEKAGHDVIVVNNGQQAVEHFITDRPDLVLMDIMMPIKNGIDAAIEIKEISEKDDDWVPIVFLSAMSKSEDIVRAIHAGGDDYLIKPVDAVILNAKLHAMQRITKMRHQLKKYATNLEQIALKDGLTGIANRRCFDNALLKEIQVAIRKNCSLSLVLCDIDSFKAYNDNYGHLEGDNCLKHVAKKIEETSKRSQDLVARYGGEEFGLILPGNDEKGALELAESIRYAVDALGIVHDYSLAPLNHVTISLGVSTIYPKREDDISDLVSYLIKSADKGLYLAKERGRNQVAVWEKEPDK